MSADYYTLLEVGRDASETEITRAYRRMAMRYHPDRNPAPDAAENFKKVTEAWEVLRDPNKRSVYDRLGHDGLKVGRGAGGPGFSGFGSFGDAFEVFMREFGGAGGVFSEGFGQPRRARAGKNIEVSVKVTLEEAAEGARRQQKIRAVRACDTCAGTGSEPGTGTVTCRACRGAGQVRTAHRTALGSFVQVGPCRDCGGEGARLESECAGCEGEGRVRRTDTVSFDLPPGVSSDDYLRIRGRGEAGFRGGPVGDLIVRVEVEPHDRFERDGDDLISDLCVTFSQAALGADVVVPTIHGEAELSVPAGIQSGQALRMRGEGMPRLRREGRGDQAVRVHVWTPKDLDGQQRELLESLAQVEDQPPEGRPVGEASFWDRVKSAFTG